MSYNMDNIKNALIEMYYGNESRLSFSLSHPQEWSEIEELAENIASCNAQTKEHPIDSLIRVMGAPEITYTTPIEDEALSRFILNSLIVTVIQLTVLENNSTKWNDAIQYCYDNGFFARLASYGRHAASDDYRDTIETFQSLGLWNE